MSSFFAPAEVCVQACTAKASTSTMATSGGGHLGARCRHTEEQVRAQQNDWIFRRAVQDLHVQIIEVAGEHARTGEREERVKRSRNCQRKTSIGINRRRRRPSCASS